MKDVLRRAILLGMGGFQYVKEGVSSLVEELEKDGKITPKEGKKLVDEIVSEGKEIAEKQYSELKDLMQKVVNDMGLVTKTDLEEMTKELKKK